MSSKRAATSRTCSGCRSALPSSWSSPGTPTRSQIATNGRLPHPLAQVRGGTRPGAGQSSRRRALYSEGIMALTAEQKRQDQGDGFLVFPHLFSREDIAEWSARLEDLVRGVVPGRRACGCRSSRWCSAVRPAPPTRFQRSARSRAWWLMTRSSSRWRAMRGCWGRSPTSWGRTSSCSVTRSMMKPAHHGSAKAYRRDFRLLGNRPAHALLRLDRTGRRHPGERLHAGDPGLAPVGYTRTQAPGRLPGGGGEAGPRPGSGRPAGCRWRLALPAACCSMPPARTIRTGPGAR